MKDELVKFETAKLAKEKGFNIPTHDYYGKHTYDKIYSEYNGYNDDYWGENWFYDWNTHGEPFKPFSKNCYSRPTQSLLQKWLREVHGIVVLLEEGDHPRNFYPTIREKDSYKTMSYKYSPSHWGDTYEEALEQALFEALTWLK